MRHRVSGRKFKSGSSYRKAMFKNMSISIIEHEVIKTTLAKAKEIRRFLEPLITIAKNDSVATRRLLFKRLSNDKAVGKLCNDLGKHYNDRPGGYLRVIKCGYRAGDAAPMAVVALVDRDISTTGA